jgi:phosphoribosylglycinamide formyltransferase 1
MPMRVGVCISGGGSNLEALVRALGPGAPASVVLVLSNTPRASGLERARNLGIATRVLDDFRDGAEWLRHLEGARVDLVVLAGFLKLVPAAVITRYRGRIINIHPSLLPEFGGEGMYGRRVHEAVLAAGRPVSGATVHLVDEAYDRGPILAQARVPVLPDDTPERLGARILDVEHQLLPAVVLAAARAGHPVPLEPAQEPTG